MGYHQAPKSNLFLLPLILLLIIINPNSATNILARDSSLSAERYQRDLLISPNKVFSCGFYNDGSNAFWFGIWFTSSADRTVVWTSNRDKPVNGRGSKLTLRGDGIMVLLDVDGTIAWASNTSGTMDVRQAELLNTGNLVLKGMRGDIRWQSFDYPTDTLLPGQLFTKKTRLVASLKRSSVFSGFFMFFFDNDNVLRLTYDGPEISSIYWPDPDYSVFLNRRTNYNGSRTAVLERNGRFSSSDLLWFDASDRGLGIKRRLTMDPDGNLRLYSLEESDGSWRVSWEAMSDLCKVHGLCGRNGICIYSPSPQCSCPPGYEMNDPSDWSKGCKPTFDPKQTCSNTSDNQPTFVEIPHTDFYGFDRWWFSNISLESCKNACLTDCTCLALTYRLDGARTCFMKASLFNGFQSLDFPGNVYIKLPPSFALNKTAVLKATKPTCVSGEENKVVLGSPTMYDGIVKNVKLFYVYVFVIGIGGVEVVFFVTGWWVLYRKRGPDPVEDGYRALLSQFRKFSYAELKKATNNFKNEIGKGGSGTVYKGELTDGRAVAVKRLGDGYGFGEEVFWAEVSTIGKINHMNLARMWGFCAEDKNRLLVYEFVENTSLDRHLFGPTANNFLVWKDRYNIAVGTAKGLAYLHHECLEWVIHCDVKPENILLGSDLDPKLSDFGLAKLFHRGGALSNFTKIRGTKGYMAPEWALNLPITAKVDVFSYGVTVLEIVRGVRVSDWEVKEEEDEEVVMKRFVKMVKMKLVGSGDDEWIDEVVDPRIRGRCNKTQLRALVEIGVSCVEEDRSKRPTMDSIVHVLMQYDDHDSKLVAFPEELLQEPEPEYESEGEITVSAETAPQAESEGEITLCT